MMETHALMKKALYPLLLLPLLFCTQVMAETTAPGLSETELARTWIARQEIAALQRRYAQATDMMAGGGTSAAAKVSALYLQILTADADMGVGRVPLQTQIRHRKRNTAEAQSERTVIHHIGAALEGGADRR